MAEDHPDLDQVKSRISQIQAAKRARIRWNMSRHTAELALDAIGGVAAGEAHRRSGKQRRRKRYKRLL